MQRTAKIFTVAAYVANPETRTFERKELIIDAANSAQAEKQAIARFKKDGLAAFDVEIVSVENRLYKMDDDFFFANATYTVIEN